MEHGDSFWDRLVVVSVSVGHLLDRVGKSAHPRGRVDNSLNDVWNRVPKFVVVVVSTHVPVHFC